jgi:hypothetical protein
MLSAFLAFEGNEDISLFFKETIRVGQKHMKMNQTGNFS